MASEAEGKRRVFVRNCVSVDVDGLRGRNRYTVKAMYDEVDEDGFADVVYEDVCEFSLTWEEVRERGGPAAVAAELRERYGEDCMR